MSEALFKRYKQAAQSGVKKSNEFDLDLINFKRCSPFKVKTEALVKVAAQGVLDKEDGRDSISESEAVNLAYSYTKASNNQPPVSAPLSPCVTKNVIQR